MSKEELRKLESKIEALSKQLRVTQEQLSKVQKSVIGVSSHMAKWVDKRRKEAEETEKKFEITIYYRSLAMGLILGIVGNMFVSYLMKALEIFEIPPIGWLLITFFALFGVLGLIWSYDREIKKLRKG